MINNFDIFPREFKEGEFYFVQLIKRLKDNPGTKGINGNNHARCIKEYSIYTQEDLDKRRQEMVDIATVCNARIYIHPARRSKDEIRKMLALLIGENIAFGKHNISGLYRHACGLNKGIDKKRIIDLDNVGIGDIDDEFIEFLSSLRPVGNKILNILPTKNGCHIISKSFDLNTFKISFPHIDCHKNNPTVLYIP